MKFGGLYQLSSAKYWLNCSKYPALVAKRKGHLERWEGPPHPNRIRGLANHDLSSKALRTGAEIPASLAGSVWTDKESGARHTFSATDVLQIRELVAHVRERQAAMPGSILFSELKADNTAALPIRVDDWFSYLDIVLAHPQQIEVIEVKFGTTPVVLKSPDPARFPYDEQTFLEMAAFVQQTKALKMLGIEPEKLLRLRLTVYQPNAVDVPTWQHEFLTYPEFTQLLTRARKAFDAGMTSKASVRAGSWCGFCPAQATCQAFSEALMTTFGANGNSPESLEQALLANPELDTFEQTAKKLHWGPLLRSYFSKLEKYAAQRATSGVRFPGFKLIRGFQKRQYADEEAVTAWIEDNCNTLPRDVAFPRQLPTPKQLVHLAQLYGVNDVEVQRLQNLILTPQGGLRLEPDHSPHEEAPVGHQLAADVFPDLTQTGV